MITDYYERVCGMLAHHSMTTHEITLALFPDVVCQRRLSHLKSAMAGRLKHWADTGYVKRKRIERRNADLRQTTEWLYFLDGGEMTVCPMCGGRGYDDYPPEACILCTGKGKVSGETARRYEEGD